MLDDFRAAPRKMGHAERFEMRFMPEPNSGCWIWLGSLNRGPSKKDIGYGRFQCDGVQSQAHRYSYEMHIGPIPKGLEIDHLCRNPCCVNPDHLEPVTHKENVRRGDASVSWAKQQRNKTHCKRGHEFSEDNIYLNKTGGRCCKACARKHALAYYYRKRARRG